jgi:hypothetical protein
MYRPTNIKIAIWCHCGRQLTQTEEHFYGNKCTECIFHELNRTNTIKEYNEWLKKVSPNTQQGEET